MTEQEIIQLHKELYDYLMGIHEKDAAFRFRVRRMNNQNRLDKGYWFNGNDDYLETSFWDYKDNLHKTSVIQLIYYFGTKKWACELVGRDSEARKVYFADMAKNLGGFIHENEKMPIWKKELDNNLGFIGAIDDFIKFERLRIDTLLKNSLDTSIVNVINLDNFNSDIKKIDDKRNKKLDKQPSLEIEQFINSYQLDTNGTKQQFGLLNLYVENFQGITKLIFPEIPLNTQWVFLTGENGFGKTSVLRAIAKLLVSEEIATVRPISRTSIIFGDAITNGKIVKYQAVVNQTANNFNIATYGVSRFALNALNQEESEKSKLKTYSLFYDNGQLLNIEQELITSFAYNKPRFEKIREKILSVIPNLYEIKIDNTNGSPKVKYKEQYDDKTPYEDYISLEDLAAGYRSILTMVGDMVVRLSSNTKDTFDDISGVVVIDEVDAHLHPKYQYELPKLLSDAFPKVQFIVSTHSPIPLLGLPEDVNSVVFKVNRTALEGITVDRLDDDFDIRRLNPNALLTSPIFGFEFLFARDAKAEDITPIDNFEEWEGIWQDLEKLKKEGKI